MGGVEFHLGSNESNTEKLFFFYADVCPFHIFFFKAEWTLANLLREGDGDKAWRCDWEMKRQHPNNTFKVPDDESLKGSVIQVRVNHSDPLFLQLFPGDNFAKRDPPNL